MYCFSCYVALQLNNYLQYSIDINTNTTRQRIRYMELTDAKIWISKMHHYVVNQVTFYLIYYIVLSPVMNSTDTVCLQYTYKVTSDFFGFIL